MFCSSCGTLGYIQTDGSLNCQKCSHVDKDLTHITNDSKILIENLVTTTGEAELRTYAVIEKLKLPTTKAYHCPECGCNDATCELRQMDQTDEPEVAFLQCQVCGYGWREA
tara:strand:- start:366 stop:698 length:333 start_codon:yes stop_codon:yes gene_type:complete